VKEVHLSPVETVIMAFNGVRSTARALNRSASSVVRWKYPKDHPSGRGNGGIPKDLKPIILQKAQELGINLTESDIEIGRIIKE
jgi:hypothetical protein